MEYEGIEQEILLEPENAIVGAVYSVNGKTGDVVLTTSDLENDSDYQTGDEVDAAITTAIAGKQDTLTAGNNIQISAENVISATDTTYSAGNGLNLSSENAFSVDTTVVATQQNLATEVQNRENADNALQAQIDGISASSDVVDIVGTYADLQNYDTSKLKDNDIIKVLQDSTQNNATTYYRWSTSTDSFTLIGQEGPYYTKSAADAQFVPQTRTVNGKALSTNITLNASDVSALGTSDVVQTTGTSTSQVMSQNATTQALGTKLNITDYVVDDELKNSTNPVQNGVLYGLLGNMPTDFFSGNATATQSGTEAQFTNALKISDIELNGDTAQQTYSGKNLCEVTSVSPYNITATLNDGAINISGTMSGAGNIIVRVNNSSFVFQPNKTYTITFYCTGTITAAGPQTYRIIYMSGNAIGSLANNSNVIYTFTPTQETTIIGFGIDLANGLTFNNYSVRIQIEENSSSTSFEPYVGGTASPNPDYPQDVQVVTGEQTVTISDGVNSQDYTVALGSIELAKIGTYQDYIYNSGGDWYVHKAIQKTILSSVNGEQNATFIWYANPSALDSSSVGTVIVASDLYLAQGTNYRDSIGNFRIAKVFGANQQIGMKDNRFANYTEFNTWLANNNLTLYYILATATDTQITDSTLIGQLNVLYSAKMLAGQTNFAVSAVSPNLPAILDITMFNANAQGIIANIRG